MDTSRRQLLELGVTGGAVFALAGCLDGDDSSNGGDHSASGGPGDASDGLPVPPVRGDPDADVTVTVFEDFACPACRRFKRQVYPWLYETYAVEGLIRYEHRDFPIPVSEPWSWAVAGAARECFEREGDDAFWAFTDEIYEYQGSYSYDVIESVADDLGLDGVSAREAAEADAHRDTLEAIRQYGIDNGVVGTPTVFVDGEPVDFDEIESAIESGLE